MHDMEWVELIVVILVKPSAGEAVEAQAGTPQERQSVGHELGNWLFFRRVRPTVCLDATYVVVYAYGHDSGKIWPPRCAVIVAALGDRCHPLPACSTPPAGAGSTRSALAAGSAPASIADLGASRRSRTIEPSGTMPYGDASLATCAPGTRPCLPRPCLVETRLNAGARLDDARQFRKRGLLECCRSPMCRRKVVMIAVAGVVVGGIARGASLQRAIVRQWTTGDHQPFFG